MTRRSSAALNTKSTGSRPKSSTSSTGTSSGRSKSSRSTVKARAQTMTEIGEALDSADIDAARALFQEYLAALGVDLSFQNFASELASLPGAYAAPRGRLLLARDGAQAAGCIALRPFEDDTCEMKRLYVRPEYRATGLGRELVARVIAEAREIGYTRIVLDTLPTMVGAQRLYERFGFRDVAPYRHNPIPGTRFLGLDL